MNELLTEATRFAEQLNDDVKLASTRLEHVRLTARANEAALLVEKIKDLINNDVERKD